MKKLLLSTLIVLACLVVLGSLSWAQNKPLDITFWHHEAPAHRVAAFQKVIDLFMKENPDINLKQEVVMWGDAWVKTLAALEANTLPDFQFSIPDLTLTMYKAGAIAPLTDLVKEMDEKYQIFPNQKNMYFYKNEYWGLPIMTMVMLMTYRPSVLEKYVGTKEPPQTWDDVINYAKKITEGSKEEIYGIGIGGAKNLMTDEQAYIFMASVGARFFDEKGNLTFNSPQTVEALKLYKDLFQYAPPGAEAWSWGEIELNIAAGTLAMSPYFPAVQKRFHEEFNSGDYDAANMPFYKDRKERGTITYPNEVHIYKKTLEKPGHKEAVYKFVRFMMRPEINAILTSGQEPGGFFPTTVAASQAKEYWDNPIVKRFENIHKVAIEALQNYASLYGFEYGKWVNIGMGDISGADILSETVNKVVSGQMTPEEAAKYGEEQMKKYSLPATE
ncbi:MAG: sugar ABC transporter substrate-binding protein [Atribacterota bacterium]|nr:sugar ABC transporter substrate-binding protein [Candidatus Atribacteria bacterium]